jgi:hypothetical protein
MKKLLVVLLFALLAAPISGNVIAQGQVNSRIIELERQRLESTLERYNNNPRLQGKSKENAVNRVKAALEQLDRDPEAYFYRQQFRTESGSKAVIGIDRTPFLVQPQNRHSAFILLPPFSPQTR